MRVAFVVDPLTSLDPTIDTTIGLMAAVQDLGAVVWVTSGSRLSAVDGHAQADALRIRLAPSAPSQDHRWLVTQPWHTTVQHDPGLSLDDMDAVFIRTEPPMDSAYLAATFVLDLIDPRRTAMVNDPVGLRACSEHLFPLRYPDLIPATMVTADRTLITDFLATHKVAVLKPVDGFAGRGVLRLDITDPNVPSLLDICTDRGRTAVVVQEFLPDVEAGNKRVFVLDGIPVGAVLRLPAPGDFRIGNPIGEAPLTDRDRQICTRLAPELRRLGLPMVGLDVIGPHLIEVNVTSPGALRKADALLGWSLCRDVAERALTREGASW